LLALKYRNIGENRLSVRVVSCQGIESFIGSTCSRRVPPFESTSGVTVSQTLGAKNVKGHKHVVEAECSQLETTLFRHLRRRGFCRRLVSPNKLPGLSHIRTLQVAGAW
jgi:hypothetical protein